jgi:predicted nucleic acid-binding protein
MRRFFDTNVLVYSQDRNEPSKRALARSLIEEAIEDEEFVVSTQVLVEFYATVVRLKMLGPAEALALAKLWSDHDTVPHTTDLLLSGLELHQAHSLSVWDGLIVQAAIEARCDVLFTEDMQDGRRFGELRIANPFAAPAGAHEPRSAYRSSRGKSGKRSVRRSAP